MDQATKYIQPTINIIIFIAFECITSSLNILLKGLKSQKSGTKNSIFHFKF